MNNFGIFLSRYWLWFFVLSFSAVQSQGMLVDEETGLVVKVLAASDSIEVTEEPGEGDVLYEMDILKPYYVMAEDEEYFQITNLQTTNLEQARQGLVGWIKKEHVHVWLTLEGLATNDRFYDERTSKIYAWIEEEDLRNFITNPKSGEYPPDFEEGINYTYPRNEVSRSRFSYPVLFTDEVEYRKGRTRSIFNVLIPALVPVGYIISEGGELQFKEDLLNTTFVVVLDITGSHQGIASSFSDAITATIQAVSTDESLPSLDNVAMGFVLLKDGGYCQSGILEVIPPKSLADAARKLREVSKCGGGEAAKSFLDTIYYASELYSWDAGAGEQGAERIIIGIANPSTHSTTTGVIDPDVPSGYTAKDIHNLLARQAIETIAIEAYFTPDPYKDNLYSLLGTIASHRANFITWRHSEGEVARQLSNALRTILFNKAMEKEREAERALEDLQLGADPETLVAGFKFLTPEQAKTLREKGYSLNVGDEGGLVVEKAWMPESPLLDEVVLVEQDNLLKLISLFDELTRYKLNKFDVADVVCESLGVRTGEGCNLDDVPTDIIRQSLGVRFSCRYLSKPIYEIAEMGDEEVQEFKELLGISRDSLNSFLGSNYGPLKDPKESVWMPIGYLGC